MQFHANPPAKAALFAFAGNAEESVKMGADGLHGPGGVVSEDIENRVESGCEKCIGNHAFFRAHGFIWGGDFNLGQPVFNDLIAVVFKVADESCMHGLIIADPALGCLSIFGTSLRIFGKNWISTLFPMSQDSIHLTDDTAQSRDAATSLLSETQLFKDYEKAFREATGLPLAIRPAKSYRAALQKQEGGNPFCMLLARTNTGCANCLKMQADLEREAGMEPKSLHCFAGLCDSAVPIRVEGELIAFLQTGQILLHQPNQEEFSRTTRQLLAWGSEVNLKALEEAYFQTKVLDETQYGAMLRLLATFAEHLATISNSIEPKLLAKPEDQVVSRAKKYIKERFQEKITLDEASQAVNASTRHFCKVFKQATGMTFTDYLARTRVEKAKQLLQNPHLRVSEIAFETGFESISQFNRSFKRITGKSPTQYRET